MMYQRGPRPQNSEEFYQAVFAGMYCQLFPEEREHDPELFHTLVVTVKILSLVMNPSIPARTFIQVMCCETLGIRYEPQCDDEKGSPELIEALHRAVRGAAWGSLILHFGIGRRELHDYFSDGYIIPAQSQEAMMHYISLFQEEIDSIQPFENYPYDWSVERIRINFLLLTTAHLVILRQESAQLEGGIDSRRIESYRNILPLLITSNQLYLGMAPLTKQSSYKSTKFIALAGTGLVVSLFIGLYSGDYIPTFFVLFGGSLAFALLWHFFECQDRRNNTRDEQDAISSYQRALALLPQPEAPVEMKVMVPEPAIQQALEAKCDEQEGMSPSAHSASSSSSSSSSVVPREEFVYRKL